MKPIRTWATYFLVGLALFILNPPSILADDPILETYIIGHGGLLGGSLDGVRGRITDKFFGNGTAKARIKYKAREDSASLSLRVSRSVTPGEIVFALLVFRVEVRGFDTMGTLVYSRDLQGFEFGDSRAGKWKERLEDLPLNATRISVTFIGNYE